MPAIPALTAWLAALVVVVSDSAVVVPVVVVCELVRVDRIELARLDSCEVGMAVVVTVMVVARPRALTSDDCWAELRLEKADATNDEMAEVTLMVVWAEVKMARKATMAKKTVVGLYIVWLVVVCWWHG